MSLTPKQQRALAIKCGGQFDYDNHEYEFVHFWPKELAYYTAAVEARRDEEVAELTRKLEEQQAVIESMRSASHKMMMMYWRMKGTNSEFITMIGGGASESEAQTLQKWKEFEAATSIEPSEALVALLAQERERCADLAKQEAMQMESIGAAHLENGQSRGRCFARARGAKEIEDAIRSLK